MGLYNILLEAKRFVVAILQIRWRFSKLPETHVSLGGSQSDFQQIVQRSFGRVRQNALPGCWDKNLHISLEYKSSQGILKDIAILLILRLN